jgi:poly-gamma-glutamate capsule biosynthesis protein CapA/YwtB (metallophosphatase superfamily)
MKRIALGLVLACATACGPSREAASRAGLRPGSPLTLAAAGDIVVATTPWPATGADREFDAVTTLLRRASLTLGNLEETVSDATHVPVRWPRGSTATVRQMARAGFTALALANNHAGDGGSDGIRDTLRILDRAGIHHAGAGSDALAAGSAVSIGDGDSPPRVAVISVTTSAADEARATLTRGEILGRPGVNAIVTDAVVTADPQTYAALSAMARATGTGRDSASGLEVGGRRVQKGAVTSVALTARPADVERVLSAIDAARATTDVVVLCVHSHEPSNLSSEPAPFVREIAHQAIDRGASLVVGTGPRQLRGIEVYKRGVILYSLGSFAFDLRAIPAQAADVFDTNVSLTEVAIGAAAGTASGRLPAYDEPVWWESVIATATFDGAHVRDVRLDPIDLGVAKSPADRGVPRIASHTVAQEILARLHALSATYGTTIRIDGDTGVVVVP